MEILRLLLITVLVAVVPLRSVPAPEQPVPQKTTGKGDEGVREMPESAKLFMGYVSAALMTAGYGMPDVAIANLGYAKQDLKNLDQDAPGFSRGAVRVGRLEFTTPPLEGERGRQRYYALFPFEGASFAVQIPELDGKTQRNLAINPRDASVVFLRTQWNVTRIRADLDEAVTTLSNRHSAEAVTALEKILGQDITGKEIKPEKPDLLQTVYNRVMLADNLLMAEDYAYCRFALFHAQEALKSYLTVKSGQYDKRAVVLRDEMQAEIAELKKNEPGFAEKMKEKMRRWIDTLKSLIASHTKTTS